MSRETVGNEARTGDLNVSGTITSGAVSNPTFTGVAQFPDGSASAPSITNTGDTNTGLFHPAEDTVAISTGGSERARVDASGRVQIGGTSTNPSRLYVRQAWQTGNGIAQIDTPSGESLSGITFANNGATKAYLYHETSGDRLWLASAGSGGVSLGYNATSEVFRINGNGLITGTGTSLGAWTSWTPTLSAGWAIGNGTMTARYCQIGKIVHFRVTVTFGSTTTFGAGALAIESLPVSRVSGVIPTHLALAVDTSTGTRYDLSGSHGALAGVTLRYVSSGSLADVTSTVPFTWADTDVLYLNGTYEAA